MNQWKNAWRSLALLGLAWGNASAEIVWSPTDHNATNILGSVYGPEWTRIGSTSDGTSILPGNVYNEVTALQRIPLRVRLGSASGYAGMYMNWKSDNSTPSNMSSGTCITYRATRGFKAEFIGSSGGTASTVNIPASTDFVSKVLTPSVTSNIKGIQFVYSGAAKDSSTAVEIVQLGLGDVCDASNNPAKGDSIVNYATTSAPFWDGASSVPAEAKSSLGGAWSSPYANAATVTAKTLAADGLMGFKATLAPTSKNPYPSAGIDLAWLASEAKANISGATGLCVTYRATAPLRAQLKQDALQYAPNYYGLDLPAQTSFKARDLPFSSFAQEKGWGYNEVLDLKRQLALRFEYKGGTASTNDVQILQVGFAGQCKDTSFAPEVLSPYKSQTTVSIAEDSVMVIPLSAIFRDRDSQSLSYSLFTAELTGEADVSIAGDTLRIEPSTNTGAGLVEITATDENGQNVQWGFDLAITDVAHAPTAAPDTFSLAEDDTLVVSGILNGVLKNDSDKDEDNFSITANSNAAKGSLTFDKDYGTFSYAPAKNFCGEDSFTYTLSDASLSSVGKVVLKVACENDPPTLSLDTTLALSLEEDFADTNLTLKASHIVIQDVDGETLKLQVSTDGHTGASLRIIGSTYLLTLSSMKDFSGTSKVTLFVKDAASDSAGVSFNVVIAAVVDAPEALPDLASTQEDKAVTIAILANDLNLDKSPLLALPELVMPPTHGMATIKPDSTLLYTPDANWSGKDTLYYKTANLGGQSALARVIVTVSPVADALAKAASPLADTSASEDFATLRLPLSLFFIDVDGNATYTASASNGKLKASVSGDTLVLASVADSNGAAIVTLTATNSLGKLSASLNVAIASVVDAPVAKADTASTLEDKAIAINVLANDLYLSEAPATLEIVMPPNHGTASLDKDNHVAYVPTKEYSGMDTLYYKVTNSAGQSSMVPVYITVAKVNDPPVLVDGARLADTSFAEDFSPVVKIPLPKLFIDVDSDTLTLEVAVGKAIVQATLNKTQDTLTFKSVLDSNGSTQVTLGPKGFAKDSTLPRLSFALAITPVNDPPSAATLAPISQPAGPWVLNVPLTATFSDADKDSLSYTVTGAGTMAISWKGDTLVIAADSATPAKTYTLYITARDSAQLSATTRLVLTIGGTESVLVQNGKNLSNWTFQVERSKGYAQLRTLQGSLIASIALPVQASQVEAMVQSHGQASVLSLGHERWLLSPANP